MLFNILAAKCRECQTKLKQNASGKLIKCETDDNEVTGKPHRAAVALKRSNQQQLILLLTSCIDSR